MRLFDRHSVIPDPDEVLSARSALEAQRMERHIAAINKAARDIVPYINRAFVSLKNGVMPTEATVKTTGLSFTVAGTLHTTDRIRVNVSMKGSYCLSDPINPFDVFGALDKIYSESRYGVYFSQRLAYISIVAEPTK